MVLAVGVAACEAPTVPLRAATYSVRDPDGFLFRWTEDRMPVRFWVNPSDSLGEYVQYAIAQWEGAFLYGEFRGVIVTDSSRADVQVEVSGPPVPTGPLTNLPEQGLDNFCGGGTGPDSLSDDGRTYFGPIRVTINWTFTGDDTPADTAARVRCLARVVTHEVGHALGLSDQSHAGTDSTDIMFTFPRVVVPSAHDRITIQQLYHTPADIAPPVRPQ